MGPNRNQTKFLSIHIETLMSKARWASIAIGAAGNAKKLTVIDLQGGGNMMIFTYQKIARVKNYIISPVLLITASIEIRGLLNLIIGES